jgi:hypothetical protein
LEIAPKTKARDFHIPTATAAVLAPASKAEQRRSAAANSTLGAGCQDKRARSRSAVKYFS